MHILVLDTIHGGSVIGAAYARAGHEVDMVDVYRNTTPDVADRAKEEDYDLIVSPVHLDPSHPLVCGRKGTVLTHHDAVRELLGRAVPVPMIEITGARGKTTTASALACLFPKNGVLHTSMGTFCYPEKRLLWKKSITPASVPAAAEYAKNTGGWLIAEESLGVTGAGSLAVITSPDDYRIASGKKSALAAKTASAEHARHTLLAPGIVMDGNSVMHLEDVAAIEGTTCRITLNGTAYSFSNPLLMLDGYRIPLALAGTAAALCGIDPAPLSEFAALPGRMSRSIENGITIIDNANSGTTAKTTLDAARYARAITGTDDLTLVIGTVRGDGAVCEGFPPGQIAASIESVRPARVILVGDADPAWVRAGQIAGCPVGALCATLEEARQQAVRLTPAGSIVLAVKTWR